MAQDERRAWSECSLSHHPPGDAAGYRGWRRVAIDRVQRPAADQPGCRCDLEREAVPDGLTVARMVPDAGLVDRPPKESGRDAPRVEGGRERRMLDARRLRRDRAWQHDFALERAVEKEPPVRAVERGRGVTPEAGLDRRDADEGMVIPGRRLPRALLEISDQHAVRRADPEEVV